MSDAVNKTHSDSDIETKSYRELHRPASEFASRSDYLDHELQIMKPRRFGLNLPGRDFRFELEDLVPALAGTIGIIAMYSAVMMSWAEGLTAAWDHVNLGKDFAIEVARVEMLIPALLFCVLASGFINPKANLAGNHGPMIPLIGTIALAGAHPLALAILIGVFGLILSLLKGGSKLVNLTSEGTAGGLLIFLGLTGTMSQINSIQAWAVGLQSDTVAAGSMGYIGLIVLAVTIGLYAFLAKVNKRWLAIPVCAFTGLAIALALGAGFDIKFVTETGLPNLNPIYWWGSTEEGWMLGLPNMEHFIASLPFAILAVAMWSPDFLGHRIFQEMNYPRKSEKVLMDVDDTMTMCSVRQMVGTAVGGGNITSSWGTYMIPAAIAKRPIPAGAILLGSLCIIVAILGFPMDVAVWPPVMRVALLVGVSLPLLEAGMQMVKDSKDSQAAGICIFGSAVVNPVLAWALTMLLDNNGLIGDKERASRLSFVDKIVIPVSVLVICLVAMLAVGMLEGQYGIQAWL
ncbi:MULTISPECIES: DUF3360 family protein [Vibrio]|jgi:hypothetical protein|uniref:DUF3360 domain-containing protein n=5 Tax=Vibrio TaxID=662 RepID=A0A0H0YPC1_VIBAL|nr:MULTISPECIES: DUF3360 family protein [Vibrio]EEZ82007.1 conserved hypothetical protein [Vibrio alginolyticus 40B]MDG2788153.1 DUF3360 family protein [Vibrio parahaemolyticus]MDW1809511.1 DUF3360 family protein [Vibrio sp. Vb2362]MDW2256442.1 DUF3360 family protein [Vibrio sp. 1409]MDW2297107.1 DUF3360 family protein [Vibrio sp. 1404]QCO85490.1 DUF3360 family protein [Vibrio neocaledonicus]QIR88066.1 DUF3360 family protein [Vibrio diabolicus]GAJ71254.1 hypothetical protein JCM18904_2003 [